MTFCVEEETNCCLPFDLKELGERVSSKVLEAEHCPFEVQIQFLLTNNAGIQRLNKEFRGIDRETDVLSFPTLTFVCPADFTVADDGDFDPESGELLLGDIAVSQDKVMEQAEEYGHSLLRECAFLIAHSVLHLCGYDHVTEEEAVSMEHKQEQALSALGITRDSTADGNTKG